MSEEHVICNPQHVFGQSSVFQKTSVWTALANTTMKWKNLQSNAWRQAAGLELCKLYQAVLCKAAYNTSNFWVLQFSIPSSKIYIIYACIIIQCSAKYWSALSQLLQGNNNIFLQQHWIPWRAHSTCVVGYSHDTRVMQLGGYLYGSTQTLD